MTRFVLGLCVFGVVIASDAAQALPNETVIDLAKQGMTDDAIIRQIDATTPPPPLTIVDEWQLTQAGVSTPVIRAQTLHALAPTALNIGTGVEQRIQTSKETVLISRIIVDGTAGGYWDEMRIHRDGRGTQDTILKTYISLPNFEDIKMAILLNGKPLEFHIPNAKTLKTLEAVTEVLSLVSSAVIPVASTAQAQDRMKMQALVRAHNMAEYEENLRRLEARPPAISAFDTNSVVKTEPSTAQSFSRSAGAVNNSAREPIAGEPNSLTFVGFEQVTVVAGTFSCQHFIRMLNGTRSDLYVDPARVSVVLPMGLIKQVDDGKDGGTMELSKIYVHETSMIQARR